MTVRRTAKGIFVGPITALIAVVGVFGLFCEWKDRLPTYVKLEYPDKAKLHLGGWFLNDEWHKLSLSWEARRVWRLDTGEELSVPIEGPWNDLYGIRFDENGRVFRINKRNLTREELRVCGGVWSADAGGGLLPIYDGP